MQYASRINVPTKRWTHYFDEIYLLNMPHQVQRLHNSISELHKYDIYFKVVEAIFDKDGENGIRRTLKAVFQNALSNGHQRILVFEDDVQFVVDPNTIMPYVVVQLMEVMPAWEMLYMGVNTHQPFKEFKSDHLLPVQEGYGLHAVCYSADAMRKILKWIDTDKRAIDVVIAHYLQTENNCYCTFPLLATQRNDFSNIQDKYMDQSYIVERFNHNVSHLITKK